MNNQINQKLIVFESNPDFSDNSRGLYEYVISNTHYNTFWIIKDVSMEELLQSKNINCAILGSQMATKMIESAKFLVTTSFEFAYQKKANQIHISAWHGFPLKLVGFFNSATHTSDFFEPLKIITTQSDIITATSRLSQLTLSGMFAMDPRKVKETGFPRNDIMFQTNGRELLTKVTDIEINKSRLILYLPTMRKGLKTEGAQFEDNFFNYPDYDSDSIDKFLESHNAYIFAKVHFADNQLFVKENFKLPKRLIFLDTALLNQHFLTIYHIMNAFDILITDYSSVYVDFLLLDKPIIFSCPDMEQYKNDRGFVVDDPTLLMPGAIVQNQKQLIYNITKIFNGKDEFQIARKEKMSFFHRYIDANSSQRLFEEMIQANEVGVQDCGKEIGHYFLSPQCSLFEYIKKDKAEFFFDFGFGFNEESKITKEYKIDDGESLICFEVVLPSQTRTIRFDPDENGRYIIKNLSILIDGIPMPYEILKGIQVDDCVIFTEIDPQILIYLGTKSAKTLRIEYQCQDLFYNSGTIIEALNNKVKEKDRVLTKIYDSYCWKLTRVFRGILSLLRRGFK